MPRLKRLSGLELVKIFAGFGFMTCDQRGSHIKLRRLTPDGMKQTLTIPNHRELDTGTARAILRQAARYIPEDQLRPHFYAD